MMGSAFYWIGVVVVALLVLGALGYALLWFYFNLLHERFGAIFFRKSERRLSIASWHAAKLVRKDQPDRDDDWRADDWPINERPFYLSYRVGERRYFVMAGWLGPHRNSPITGKHPPHG